MKKRTRKRGRLKARKPVPTRAQRSLEAVRLLAHEGQKTTREIGDHLKVSERTAYRIVGELRKCGMLIRHEPDLRSPAVRFSVNLRPI